jgi:hypothetical protein
VKTVGFALHRLIVSKYAHGTELSLQTTPVWVLLQGKNPSYGFEPKLPELGRLAQSWQVEQLRPSGNSTEQNWSLMGIVCELCLEAEGASKSHSIFRGWSLFMYWERIKPVQPPPRPSSNSGHSQSQERCCDAGEGPGQPRGKGGSRQLSCLCRAGCAKFAGDSFAFFDGEDAVNGREFNLFSFA